MIVSQVAIGSESNAAAALTAFWTNFSAKQFYKSWLGGIFRGYYFKTSLYDSEPMISTIEKLQSGPFQRFFGVGTTDLASGSYVFFNSTGQSSASMATGILASASEGGIFSIVEYKSFKLVSGTTKTALDLLQGISACQSMGYSPNNIIIDVVLSAGKTVGEKDPSEYKTYNVLMRYLEISSSDNQNVVIENTELNYPQVNIRSVIMNHNRLADAFGPYDYWKFQRERQLAFGEEDAKNAVKDIA